MKAVLVSAITSYFVFWYWRSVTNAITTIRVGVKEESIGAEFLEEHDRMILCGGSQTLLRRSVHPQGMRMHQSTSLPIIILTIASYIMLKCFHII